MKKPTDTAIEEVIKTLEEFADFIEAKNAKHTEEMKKKIMQEDRLEEEESNCPTSLSFLDALGILLDDYAEYGDDGAVQAIVPEDDNEGIAICHADESPEHPYLIKAVVQKETGYAYPSTIRPYTITNEDLFSKEGWQVIFKEED